MKKLFAIIVFVALLPACAPAPTPAAITAVPSATAAQPQPTASPAKSPAARQTPAPTPNRLTVVDITKSKQPDGSIRTTAQVNVAETLGLGQMEIASPDTMLMGETRTIRLKLSPAQQLASITPVAAPGKTPDLPQFVYKFGGNIQLYPVMFAELRTLSFDVDLKGPIRRDVNPNVPAFWDWIVSPRAPGQQALAIELAVPAVVNGVGSELSTSVLQDLPIVIVVQAATPTPVPLSDRIGESIANNTGAIVVAL
ncbi:MAG: hypothetical protein KGJ80_19525, partial [Chloroflexota bacterium]|nr:hypothetical protein [Chloroflexota bacterium]